MERLRIGIVGAGPAGAYAAWRAARLGHEVTFFDHRAPWEKPCGGGVTVKAQDDFPWIGEACDTSYDTCWQIEYESHCEPTGDPSEPATAGVCVLTCAGPKRCTDRDGVAPLACVGTSEGDVCLSEADVLNHECADVPGTVKTKLDGVDVCVPYAW